MASDLHTGSLAVIGGGVIGLSVARRAAQAGWPVRVHRSDERGAGCMRPCSPAVSPYRTWSHPATNG